MRASTKWVRAVLAVGLMWGVATTVSGAAAQADSVPFQDPHQDGALTFCNRSEQPVSSGKLSDIPFVWTAVSSAPAPAGYTRADLLVFQPIQHVDPSGWEGYQMTVAATFSNSKHPMTQATYADNPLASPNAAYPPYWDGLYEVRMYFTAPYQSEEKSSYPAAVIRVQGDGWTLLRGGGGSCTVGTAVSRELSLLPPSRTETPSTVGRGGPGAAAGTTSIPPTSSAAANGGGPPAANGSGTGSQGALASGATTNRGGTSSPLPWIVLSLGVVIVAAAGGWLVRRRQPKVN